MADRNPIPMPMPDKLSQELASLRIAREENPEAKARNRNLLVIAGVALVVLVTAGIVLSTLSSRLFKSEVTVTEIRLISPAQSSIQVSATGYVVPQLRSKVGASVSGRVAKVLVQEGDKVKAGDLLVVIDSREEAAAARAAKARADQARRQYEREKKLSEQGATPRSSAEDLESTYLASQADYERLEENLAKFDIHAPFAGVVIGKPVEVGELVGPGTPQVLELSDLDSNLVEADVPEARLHVVKQGSPAEIVLDAYPETRFRGEVSEISPRVDRAKATVVVKVKFVDPTTLALPDMAARVSFLSKPLDAESIKTPSKLYVPASAVADRDGRKVVFVVENEKVREEPVALGASMADGFELTNGPPDGTKVVANPPKTLGDGQKIKEKEP